MVQLPINNFKFSTSFFMDKKYLIRFITEHNICYKIEDLYEHIYVYVCYASPFTPMYFMAIFL